MQKNKERLNNRSSYKPGCSLGTSVGANYMEANQASSRKDFRNKIYIAKKEANETMHWLRMITKACPDHGDECRSLWQEAKELTLIFSKITSTLNSKK